MSSVLIIVALTLVQFATGFGLLSLFKIRLKPGMHLPLSVLMGVAFFSVVPFLLQLFFVPLTGLNVFLSLAITCLLLNVRPLTRLRQLRRVLLHTKFSIKLYEVPLLLVIAFIVLVSVWRCFYLPPTSRDLTSGAEVIAEYTVREKTMINSVFSLHLETLNNHFKSPFIISLQVIYKYAGIPFGQVWLSNIFVCFVIFLYHALGLTLHRLLAGLLLVCFLAIPEMYAYTFLVLYDYSNAVFFFLSVFFLIEFFQSNHRHHIIFAGLLMAVATYIRSETLVLALLLSLSIVWHYIKTRGRWLKLAVAGAWFVLPAVLAYLVMANIYISHYLPIHYEVGSVLNTDLLNLRPLLDRFLDINLTYLFSLNGTKYFGYFFFIFFILLVADLFYAKTPDTVGMRWIYPIVVVYFGLALLGYLLPLLDLHNSTKRGLFKIFPLMLLYLANSTILKELSAKINNWETRKYENVRI